MENKLKIYIGSQAGEWLPVEVLKYSILKRTKTPIEFQSTRFLKSDVLVNRKKGESLDRYWIPESENFIRKVLYLTAGMVVLSDINELIQLPIHKGALALPLDNPPTSYMTGVMVLDCPKLKDWQPKEISSLLKGNKDLYQDYFFARANTIFGKNMEPLPPEWHYIDKWDEKAKIVDFQNIYSQPWKYAGHPYEHIFVNELQKAIQEGFFPHDALEREKENRSNRLL